MGNQYYDNSDPAQRFQPGTTVRADEVDGKFDEVTAGFDATEIDTDRALKLPFVSGVSQEITATALQRRRKILGFDADGNLALSDNFTFRDSWTANTSYKRGDVLVAPSKNLYVVDDPFTSGATFDTANLTLAINVEDVEAAKTAAQSAASTATTKAGEASASAITATTKAGEASTSASNAAGSAVEAKNAVDTYDNLSAGFAARRRETRKVAAQDQAVFNLADVTYITGINNIQVYVNGVAQVSTVDFLETDQSTITFLTGLDAGDYVDLYVNQITDGTYDPEARKDINNLNVSSVAELKTLAVEAGKFVSTKGYYAPGDGGGNDYEIVAAATGTADGGSFIDLGNGLQARGLFSGAINIKQFGAVGDGIAEDGPSVQAAFELSEDFKIVVPAGNFRISQELTVSNKVVLMGLGINLSFMDFYANAYINFTGSQSEFDSRGSIIVRDLKLRSATINPNPCIKGIWSGGIGGTSNTVSVLNVDMSGINGLSSFAYGFDLTNARNTSFFNYRFLGDRDSTTVAAEAAVKLSSDQAGVEHKFAHCQFFFAKKGVDIAGNGEGYYFNQIAMVAVGTGIKTSNTGGEPLLLIAGSHINCWESCLDLDGTVQFNITQNLFYIGDTDRYTHLHKEMVRVRIDSAGINLGSSILNNQFFDTSTAPTVVGIRVRGAAGTETVTIDQNIFAGTNVGISLIGDTTGVYLGHLNRFLNNTVDVEDLTTTNGNARYSAPPYAMTYVAQLTDGATYVEVNVPIPKGYFRFTPDVVVAVQASGIGVLDVLVAHNQGSTSNSPTNVVLSLRRRDGLAFGAGGIRLSVMAAVG